MSIFLERQEVRKKMQWGAWLKRVERASLAVMIVVAGFAMLYGLYVLVFLGPYFSVADIVVQGRWRHLDAASLVAQSGAQQGDNLFFLNVNAVHDRLMENPWVRRITVRRQLPHTLFIAVEEYAPEAIVVRPDGMHFVDGDAQLFKPVAADDPKDFPLITGIGTAADIEDLTGKSEGTLIEEALEVMHTFKASTLGTQYGLAELHFDPMRGYSIVTEKPVLAVLVGLDDPRGCIHRLDDLTSALGAREGRLQYILADEPGRIIVKYKT